MAERLLLLQLDVESAIHHDQIKGLLRDDEHFVEEISWTGFGGPRRPRSAETNATTVDWYADRATLDDLLTNAISRMERGVADRLVVVARMPLPLALHLGMRLFACSFKVDVINIPVAAHPPSRCAVTKRDTGASADVLNIDNLPALPAPAAGVLALYVSTAPLLPTDRAPIVALAAAGLPTAVEVRAAPTAPLTVTDANLPTLARQLEAVVLRANQLFPNARDLAVFFRGPIELAVALGRAINANTWHSVRFAHHEAGSYALPITQERRPVTSSAARATILHLSDLHLTADTRIETFAHPLLKSLNEDGHPAKGGVDALVITGDLTNRALVDEFSKATDLIKHLAIALHLPLDRISVVPGNHDLSWDVPVYEWRWQRQLSSLKEDTLVRLQSERVRGALWRNPDHYPKRFEGFARFYEATFSRPWSLAPEEQFTRTATDSLSILGLNSAWEIDEARPENASLQPDALTAALMAYDHGPKGALGIAAWHHPVSDSMKSTGLLQRLADGGVHLVLHGHVHEDRQEATYFLDRARKLYSIGAGTLGLDSSARPESTPALFNVLTIHDSPKRCRVHVYKRQRANGSVEPYAKFRTDKHSNQSNFFDLDL